MKILHYSEIFGIPEFLDSGWKSWTLDSECWTLDAGVWTLEAGLWTLDSGPWTLSFTVVEQNQNSVSDFA